jgi:pimeloyl-ACP methyl ester carboxylesterase
VAEWERLPLLALAPNVAEAVRIRQTTQRLQNDPLGLANSLRGMGAGQQAPLWSLLPDLRMPTLLIAGDRDTRYRRLAERMSSLLPASSVAIIADAGHTVHLDQPAAFVSALQPALQHLALTTN